jgi:hypothetical protein
MMSENDERAEIAARLEAIDEARDMALLRLAVLAVTGGARWWERLERLGEGVAARAVLLLAEAIDATIAEAEAYTINAVTPRMWIAGCGHLTCDTSPPSMCDACAV